MKKFLQRGVSYSFFNLRNIAAGFLSTISVILLFLVLRYTRLTFYPKIAGPPPQPTTLTFTIVLLVFFAPSIFMGRKHGWKSGLSTLVFGLLFLIPVMLWFFTASIKLF